MIMLRKLHLKLTLLCGFFTTAILCAMSVSFFLSSENTQWKNAFAAFQSDMNSLLTNLENQQTISHLWLKKMENQTWKIYLEDNGTPYHFNTLSLSESEAKIMEQARVLYEQHWLDNASLNIYTSLHTEFGWSKEKEGKVPLPSSTHFIGCMTFLRNKVPVTAIVLASQDALRHRLFLQRVKFLAADLAGSIAFFLFSFFFTGKLLKPAEEAQQRQIEFIASASHELRTPLSVILASTAACEIAPPEEQQHFFDSIKREGKRMQGLIHDMLFLASGQNAPAVLAKSAADSETLLLNLYENFEPLAQQKELCFTIHLPEEELPSLFCDMDKITQLLSILLQNAFSYTPAGGRVSLSALIRGKNLLLSVSDTGCGIPDAEKKRVFERFYRAETARSQKNHFGLGLCIAQDIVKAHHGALRVTDNLPCGTVFTAVLPLLSPDREK